MTELLQWYGPVHEFFTDATHFGCSHIENGQRCGLAEEFGVHKFTPSSSCMYPMVAAELFVQRSSGIHWATVAWQAENQSSWYSGWYKPHNDQSMWRRAEVFDCKAPGQIAQFIELIVKRSLDEDYLIEKGVKNQ